MKSTISIVQQPPVFQNLPQSAKLAEKIIIDCAKNGADVVVFPESWLCGYPLWLDSVPGAAIWDAPAPKKLFRRMFENSVQAGDEHILRLLKICAKRRIYCILGSNEREGGTIYNSILTFDWKNENVLTHRKLVPTYAERLVWGRGDGSSMHIAETPFGNIGSLICWEHWLAEARIFMHKLSETLHAALWPSVRELHELASRHYAFEGQCFVAAAGCSITKADAIDGIRSIKSGASEMIDFLGTIDSADDDFLYDGGSCVIAPDARFIVEPRRGTNDPIFAEIDAGEIAEGKNYLDTSGHYSRPDIFTLQANVKPMKNVVFNDNDQLNK